MKAIATDNGPGPNTRQRATTALFVVFVALLVAVGVVSPVDAHGTTRYQRADVLDQGGDGVHQRNGARLIRRTDGIDVRWRVSTPTSGSYVYPTPDQVPPGAPLHPPIEPGSPEVFTLWAFVFNFPDACSDPCDSNDIGDTPAQGGVYQVDGLIEHGRRIQMGRKVRLGEAPAAGSALQDPFGAEVHVAMAPHGMARTGDDLVRQLNSSVGTPATWWPAIFAGG